MLSPAELTISVIIPVYNGGKKFQRCLSSLAEAIPSPDAITVVADGDTDGSWRVAEQFGARVIRIPGPGGPARARNIGAHAAQGDILLFIDADVAVYPDILSRVAAAFRCEPDLAAVFGCYDDAPTETNFLSQYKNLLHHYVHQTAREKASTFWGACGAIRREVFLALGGFDERYRQPSIEDVELGCRLKQAGYRIRLCKTLQVKHMKRWGVVSLIKSDFLQRALPWATLILRERRFINDLNVKRSSRVSVILTYGLLGALVGAWWWPKSLAVAGTLVLALLTLNAPFYRFFQNQRGLRFALQTIPWHWLYYFYCGIAFAMSAVRHLFCRLRSPWKAPPETFGKWSDKKAGSGSR